MSYENQGLLADAREGGPKEKRHLSRLLSGAYLLVLFVGLVVWAALLPGTFARNTWIYVWDSAPYLETAQSLLEGRGLVHRTTFGLESELWQPLSLWPPGYSVFIAGLQAFGLAGVTSCTVVSVLAGAISVAAIAFIYSRLFSWALALPLIIILAASVAFQTISTQCLSDATYLALTAVSLACLVHWTSASQASLWWIFSAGLLAGGAWVTRNAGLALFAATGVFFAAHLLWTRFDQVAKASMVWLGGAAVCSLPLIIRNLITFGDINPYDMPPSDLSLWQNLHQAFSVILTDMTTSASTAELIVEETSLILVALIVIAVPAFRLAGKSGAALVGSLKRNRLQIFFVCYALFYFVLVVMARTKYRWGDIIDSRYMVQIYWVVWASFAVWSLTLVKLLGWGRVRARAFVILFFGLIALLHVREQWQASASPPDRSHALEGRLGNPACTFLQENVKEDQLVVAVRADLLRNHCNVHARVLRHVLKADAYRKAITDEDIQRASQDGRLWGLVVDDAEAAGKGDFGQLVKELVEVPGRYPEWERVSIDSPAAIFRYVGPVGAPEEPRPEAQ